MNNIENILKIERKDLLLYEKIDLENLINEIDLLLPTLEESKKYILILKKLEILKILRQTIEAIPLLKNLIDEIDDKKYSNQKIEFLIELGKYYTTSGKVDIALGYLNQAEEINLSNEKNVKKLIRIMMLKAEVFSKNHKINKAMELFSAILKLSQSNNLELETANCYSDMGLMEIRQKNYKNALKNYLISEKIYQKLNSVEYLYLVYANISLIYFKQGNFTEAINYSLKAAEIGEKRKEWLKVSQIYNNLGSIYIKFGKNKKAEYFLKKSIRLKIKIGDKVGLAKALNNISEILMSQKNFKDAKKYLKMSYKLKERNNDKAGLISVLSNLAGISYQCKNYEKSLNYLFQAESLLNKFGSVENYINIYKHFYRVYEKMHDYEKATKYFELYESKYFEYKNNVYDSEMQNLLKKYEKQKAEKEKKIFYLKNIQLKKANENKNKLFSIIAHDLKSPFSSIISFISLMKHGYGKYPPEKIQSWVLELEKIVGDTFVLLENLLTWSKLHSDAIRYEPNSLNIKNIAEEAISVYKMKAKAKNIKVLNKIDSDLYVFADNFMIKTVLRNILNNAIKFTPQNGEISFSSKIEDKNVKIFIKDTGIGISQENIKKLFKLETSFTTVGTEHEKGTGLGLIVCNDFIKANKGKIEVESEINKGTTFIITLPIGNFSK